MTEKVDSGKTRWDMFPFAVIPYLSAKLPENSDFLTRHGHGLALYADYEFQGLKFCAANIIQEMMSSGMDTWDAYEAILQVMVSGSTTKYEPWSWLNIEEPQRKLVAAMHRHVLAHAKGVTVDPEYGHSHLAHAGANAIMLIAFEIGVQDPKWDTWRLQGDLRK